MNLNINSYMELNMIVNVGVDLKTSILLVLCMGALVYMCVFVCVYVYVCPSVCLCMHSYTFYFSQLFS